MDIEGDCGQRGVMQGGGLESGAFELFVQIA